MKGIGKPYVIDIVSEALDESGIFRALYALPDVFISRAKPPTG
jgi:hypothetical protein